jgi:hypothetical protein
MNGKKSIQLRKRIPIPGNYLGLKLYLFILMYLLYFTINFIKNEPEIICHPKSW